MSSFAVFWLAAGLLPSGEPCRMTIYSSDEAIDAEELLLNPQHNLLTLATTRHVPVSDQLSGPSVYGSCADRCLTSPNI